MSLTTIGAGSMVFAVGNDWSGAAARTVGAGQTKVHEYLAPTGDTFWAQPVNGTVAAAGTVTTINDAAPTNHRWNLVAVEIRPALVLTPGAVAVDGVASGDTADGANIVANGLTTT